MPKLPKYKDSIDGRFIVHYEKGAISTKELKNNKIKLSKSIIEFNTKINLDNLIATRIVPNKSHFILEVIYEKEIINHELDTNNIIGIDLGVNNLMSCSTKNKSFIINGKPLKSIKFSFRVCMNNQTNKFDLINTNNDLTQYRAIKQI